MPRMDGFEMLHRLPEKNFHLIFTTAYDQYAIKAIKYAAFDYLLKPIDIEELKMAISKIHSQQKPHTVKNWSYLIKIYMVKILLIRLRFPLLDGLLFFNIRDIIHLEANSNYTTIYFINGPNLLPVKRLKILKSYCRQIFFSHTSFSSYQFKFY